MENWHDERGKFAQGNPGGPGSIGLHPIQDELEKLTDEQLIKIAEMSIVEEKK